MIKSCIKTLFTIIVKWEGIEYYLGSDYNYVPKFYFWISLEDASLHNSTDSAQNLIDIWERCTNNRTTKIVKIHSKLKLENGEVA